MARNDPPPTGTKAACREAGEAIGEGHGATRRVALALLAGRAATAVFAAAVLPRPARAKPGFGAFLESLWPAAQAKGVRRETFDAAVAGLTPDPGAPKASGKQAEFDIPLQTYYRSAVSSNRVMRGRALAAQYAAVLSSIESRYGVPAEICLAAWGMETDFGRGQGNRDLVRTLATLAYTRPDRPLFRNEFVALLVILDRGQVPRERLKGSWAGAMGGPQFLPSAYLKYAVGAEGGRDAPDIWTNGADVLASIANFLHSEGWAAGQPWIEEVVIPEGFAFPSLHGSAADWAGLGLRRPDGRSPAGEGDVSLFLPSGAAGPAFLLYPNFFVIKTYNTSDSYALSFGSLAQRIAGGAAPSRPWPAQAVVLSRTDKAYVQGRLAGMGLYEGPRDGKFGPKVRDSINAYQRRAGLQPADGFATPALVASLRAGR